MVVGGMHTNKVKESTLQKIDIRLAVCWLAPAKFLGAIKRLEFKYNPQKSIFVNTSPICEQMAMHIKQEWVEEGLRKNWKV